MKRKNLYPFLEIEEIYGAEIRGREYKIKLLCELKGKVVLRSQLNSTKIRLNKPKEIMHNIRYKRHE